MKFRLTLALVAVLVALPALAETRLVKLQTGDASRSWMAVGKLILGEREFCTGALVAPDLVLTAAHCLFDQTTGARFADAQIRFLDGWRNGRAEAYRGARASVVYPGYDFGAPDMADRVSRDLALIALDQPILLPQVPPFPLRPAPGQGADVAVVSYAQDRAEAPSLQSVCHVLERQDAMLVLDCDVDFGSSGAPVFTIGPDGPAIISVISAKAEAAGQKVALASALEDPLPALVAELERLAPRRRDMGVLNGGVLNGGVLNGGVLNGGGALGAGGAKLIRVEPAATAP